uniref:Photosystem II protein L n=1 Tax=Torreya jiulongshanensis TaxID=3029022 RepID=A0A7D7PVU0_9CONI|nr:photosystem II protein L [Torreya jiulongshanensis]QMS50570.1 photosystem II protein L [Torreya jiulongshanensis]
MYRQFFSWDQYQQCSSYSDKLYIN